MALRPQGRPRAAAGGELTTALHKPDRLGTEPAEPRGRGTLLRGAAYPAFVTLAFVETVGLQRYLGQFAAALGSSPVHPRAPVIAVVFSVVAPALVAGALIWKRGGVSPPQSHGITWPHGWDVRRTIRLLRSGWRPSGWTWRERALTSSLLLALGAAVVAGAAARSPETRPAAQWLWAGATGLFLVAAMLWQRRRSFDSPRWSLRRDGPAIAVLCTLALALRLPNLRGLPYVVHGDEAANGLQALRWLNGDVHSVLETGWYGLPMAGYGLPAMVMRVAGANLFGLRLSSVLIGTLSIVATYGLAREFVSRRVAFLAAALLAVAAVHIHFSRTGFHYMAAVTVVTLTLWLLVRALRTASAPAAVLTGIGMSVALQVYFSARILFVIVPLFLLALSLFARPMLVGRGSTLAWLGGSLAVTLGPLLMFFASSRDTLVSRAVEVEIFAPDAGMRAHLVSQFGTADPASVLLRQLAAVPLLPSGLADQANQYGAHYAAFDALVAGLVLVGLFGAVLRPHVPVHPLLLIWVLATIVVGGVLTVDFPSWQRLAVMTPALMLLAALAAENLVSPIERACVERFARFRFSATVRRSELLAAGVALGLLGIVIGVSAQNTWVNYFTDYTRVVNNDQYRTRFTDVANYVVRLPASTYVILFARDDLSLSYDTPAFLLSGRHAQTTVQSVETLMRVMAQNPGGVVIVPPSARSTFETAIDACALATSPTLEREEMNPAGALLFTAYRY